MSSETIHVGLCGAGIGGLAASIPLRRAGAQVTVLEAAAELGEIGAGIQMTPNFSRLLVKWGVADVIGDNLVESEELNMRRRDGTMVGTQEWFPIWWVVQIAEKSGAKLIINSRVDKIEYEASEKVTVTTTTGKSHTFNLLIGSDGVNSIIRRTLYPDVKPSPPTTNCAYRAIVPYSQIRNDPISKELIEKLTMEVWMSENAYIITYPISAGKDFNLVLSHVDHPVNKVEEIDIDELRNQYKDLDPRIKRIVDIIPEAQRWPLLVTELKSWSSPRRNVVLMGDAAHSMTIIWHKVLPPVLRTEHFFGRCIAQVVSGHIAVDEAVKIYEKARMPKARFKQQQSRDEAMEPELRGGPFLRSPNLYGDPSTVLSVYAYDAETHADAMLFAYIKGKEQKDEAKNILKTTANSHMKWFLPDDFEWKQLSIQSKL